MLLLSLQKVNERFYLILILNFSENLSLHDQNGGALNTVTLYASITQDNSSLFLRSLDAIFACSLIEESLLKTPVTSHNNDPLSAAP